MSTLLVILLILFPVVFDILLNLLYISLEESGISIIRLYSLMETIGLTLPDLFPTLEYF